MINKHTDSRQCMEQGHRHTWQQYR